MSHTPGPWAAEAVMGDYETDICLDYHVQGREFPIVIASVLFDDEDDGATRKEIAEAKANARLIAAAPDLLAACEYVVDHIDPFYRRDAVDRVRAAIAKAKGEPS